MHLMHAFAQIVYTLNLNLFATIKYRYIPKSVPSYILFNGTTNRRLSTTETENIDLKKKIGKISFI